MASILDRGLTSGGWHRLSWFVPEVEQPVVTKPNVLRYTSSLRNIPIRASSRSTAIVRIISSAPRYLIKSRTLVSRSLAEVRAMAVVRIENKKMNYKIIPQRFTKNIVMSLPTNEVKGTTVLFDVEVDLSAAAPDILLVYFAEGIYEVGSKVVVPETFQITSLPSGGITLLSSTSTGGVFTYKWRCRIAPEITRNLVNETFNTYCRIFFGTDIVELDTEKLILRKGKPDNRPT